MLIELEPHHADDVIDFVAAAQTAVMHVTPGGVIHLVVLQMEPCARKIAGRARVIVVEMGDDDITRQGCVDPQHRQCFGRCSEQRAPAPCRRLCPESRVDDDRALAVTDEPDMEIERHVGIVRVTADEIVPAPRATLGVLHRVDFVAGQGHVPAASLDTLRSGSSGQYGTSNRAGAGDLVAAYFFLSRANSASSFCSNSWYPR